MNVTLYPFGLSPETRWTGILKIEPDNVDQTKKYPCVIFLHGRGQHGKDLNIFYNNAIPQGVKTHVNLKQFIVFAPQTIDNDTFFNTIHLNNVFSLISKTSNIDLSRVYVTGLSLGGYGTWIAGQELTSKIAAIIPICGCGEAEKASRMIKLPVWAFHNSNDPVVNPVCTSVMVDAIKNAGGNPRVTWYTSSSHDAWTATYNNPQVWDWLLSHRLGQSEPQVNTPVNPCDISAPVKVRVDKFLQAISGAKFYNPALGIPPAGTDVSRAVRLAYYELESLINKAVIIK